MRESHRSADARPKTACETRRDNVEIKRGTRAITLVSAVKKLLLEHMTVDTAKMPGLPVSQELDPVIYELMRLYSQPVRQSAAVEYLPTRREAEGTSASRAKG